MSQRRQKLSIAIMIQRPCAEASSGLSSGNPKISNIKFVICQSCFWVTTSLRADYSKYSKCPQCGRNCINCIPISTNQVE